MNALTNSINFPAKPFVERQPDQAEQEDRHRRGGDRVRATQPSPGRRWISTRRSWVLRKRITANAPIVIIIRARRGKTSNASIPPTPGAPFVSGAREGTRDRDRPSACSRRCATLGRRASAARCPARSEDVAQRHREDREDPQQEWICVFASNRMCLGSGSRGARRRGPAEELGHLREERQLRSTTPAGAPSYTSGA